MSRTDAEIRADLDFIASLDWVTKDDEDRLHRLAADVPTLLAQRDAALAVIERVTAWRDELAQRVSLLSASVSVCPAT